MESHNGISVLSDCKCASCLIYNFQYKALTRWNDIIMPRAIYYTLTYK